MKKFTLSLLALIICAMTFAQTAITSPSDIQPGKTYWISNGQYYTWNYASAMYFDRIFGDRICLGYFGQADPDRGDFVDNPEDPDQQFAFIEYNNHLYLYSVGADNFVSMKDGGAHIMSSPENFVTVTPNSCSLPDFPWNIKFDGEIYIGAYWRRPENGYITCIDDQTATTNSNAWKILEVGELENVDEITKRLADNMSKFDDVLSNAQDSLMYTYERAEEFLWGINYKVDGGNPIELQASDPGAANYIWCNEPEMSEGSMEGLLDDDETTFFHSCWNGTIESVHWLGIDLGTPIKDFMFSYQTRHNATGNFPESIEVQGSNDGVEFVTLGIFNQGLPKTTSTVWDSENIKADKEYSYLRFMIYAPHVYWHMAKFELKTERFITVDEEYQAYLSYLNDLLKAIEAAKRFIEKNEATKPEEYYAYAEQITSKMEFIKKLASDSDDEETIALVAEAEELYALEGVGYPGEAPRATFKEVIDAAKAKPTTQAGLDLKAAMQAYIESHDIVLPKSRERYTLTFVTTQGRRNFLNVDTHDLGDFKYYTLSMVEDTYTSQGNALPETAAFVCIDNEDGTYEFVTSDGKYLGIPVDGAYSGSETGLYDEPTYFTIEKMYPNEMCNNDITYNELFGLVALCGSGLYMVPQSSGEIFYVRDIPNFQVAWTSAMRIEPWTPGEDTGIENVGIETVVEGIYDLQGRKVENPSTGIYIVNGKKVLVK